MSNIISFPSDEEREDDNAVIEALRKVSEIMKPINQAESRRLRAEAKKLEWRKHEDS